MNTLHQSQNFRTRIRIAFAKAISGIAASSPVRSLAEQDLIIALDATILAWAQTLESRKGGASQHIQRVTDWTMVLARAIGIADTELDHVRRGAILHDIGEMRLPDAILLKPGKLLPDERTVLHQHPQHAYEMLYPIPYLRPAIDIPYCHHERWDGAGYPRGLKGEQVPLAARVFAVVDTWDSLHTDRLYRKAWPDDAAWRFLDEQAGAEYDPDVVKVFHEVLKRLH